MAYNNFTLSKAKKDFCLTVDENQNLFSQVEEIAPSDFLRQSLDYYLPLATTINTEKARSGFIIAPIMGEIRRQSNNQISLFSGSEFNVDQIQGLNGYCDFILSASQEQIEITAPVFTIIEAKKEDIIGGVGQCIAAMVAAQIFNERAENNIKKIYGAVTTGTTWRFILLAGKEVSIDSSEYYIVQIGKILGILLQPLHRLLT